MGQDVQTGTAKPRVFISYKRDSDPDEEVATALSATLKAHHDAFIDRDIPVGMRWAERIEAELRRADFVIPLLSAESVHSEMVLAEIETAHHLAAEQGRPRILPVRLAYRESFDYPLSAYLNPIQWAFWNDPSDTAGLIDQLLRALSGGELAAGDPVPDTAATMQAVAPPPYAAQPPCLERPEGAMDSESAFYVERSTDRIAVDLVGKQGFTLVIKAPRQMGKSSLLMRTMERARKAGKQVVFLDFQLFEKAALASSDLFFRQFCQLLTDELDIEDRTEEHWQRPMGNSQRTTRYLGRYLLPALDAPLLLAMDEVDSTFESSFRTDFFGMLRNWHNRRGEAGSVWKRLDLALVTSTEPYQLIADLNQSPFNVGEVVELEDLTMHQVRTLNVLHGSPLASGEVERLMALLSGHPYLVRRALYLLAQGRLDTARLFEPPRAQEEQKDDSPFADRGPFGDHLRYHLFRIYDKPELVNGLRAVIQGRRCKNEEVFWRLRGAGLVRREGGREVPRCQLYAEYFRRRLHV